MEIKTFNPITILYFTKQVKLSALNELVRFKAKELYKDAALHDIEITGPIYWIYYGMDGNPETVFTLEIALPVTEPENYQGNFQVKKLGQFNCLSTSSPGSWNKLPVAYGNLFGEINEKGYTPTGECREIYLYMDFLHPENNLTEIQVGLQSLLN
jgi:effector-binding domain-containing protein